VLRSARVVDDGSTGPLGCVRGATLCSSPTDRWPGSGFGRSGFWQPLPAASLALLARSVVERIPSVGDGAKIRAQTLRLA